MFSETSIVGIKAMEKVFCDDDLLFIFWDLGWWRGDSGDGDNKWLSSVVPLAKNNGETKTTLSDTLI